MDLLWFGLANLRKHGYCECLLGEFIHSILGAEVLSFFFFLRILHIVQCSVVWSMS
jgi:hypothetical protein